jgi:thioredoxin reductase
MDSYNALIICSDPAGLFAAMQFESFGIEDCLSSIDPHIPLEGCYTTAN